MREHTTFRGSKLLLLLLCICLCLAQPVRATAVVGMHAPDAVQRGQSFKVQIFATGASQGNSLIQVYVKYPVESFNFVKGNSSFLGTLGGDVTSPTDSLNTFEMLDKNGIIALLAMGIPYAALGDVIAELEFTAKADAPIGPVSFKFDSSQQPSYVQLADGTRVDATSENLNFQVTDIVSQPLSNEPLPPADPPAEPQAPGIEEPYNPANQIQPAEGLEGKNPAGYGIGKLNEETTAEPTDAPSKPSVPEPKRTSPSETDQPHSDLQSVTGELLYVPEGGLPLQEIPAGFKGDTAQMMGVNIPVAKSESKQLTLYYLKSKSAPAFYTYEQNTQRFKYYDLAKLKASETTASKQGAFSGAGAGNSWKILLVSLVGLSSLSVLVYSLKRNLLG
ncbi:MAG: hypothetical protein SPK23_02190 [Eubacteriales bacterium]|nr:hypothetical protein [Eubacteriales bacterium]